MNNKHLLLASQSPRRRQLLGALGLPVSYIDIQVDETLQEATPAHLIAETLAARKSHGYSEPLRSGQVLVTADTIVVHHDEVMGKPHSREEAFGMLRRLMGDVHQVYTGVALRTQHSLRLFTECTDVYFRPLGDEQINHYLDNYQYMDKAGAYGIQDWIGMVAVQRIDGCYYNVVGLPVARLAAELEQLA